jgi:hypothetical protein
MFEADRYRRSRSGIGEARLALFETGLQRLDLVRPADQTSLFDGLGNETGVDIACDGLAEQPFGGADRVGAAPRDVAGGCNGGGPGVVD